MIKHINRLQPPNQNQTLRALKLESLKGIQNNHYQPFANSQITEILLQLTPVSCL